MNEALMRKVVGVAMFFEGGKDDVIDPDVALKQLEWIYWSSGREWACATRSSRVG
jgi:hypothetical protein